MDSQYLVSNSGDYEILYCKYILLFHSLGSRIILIYMILKYPKTQCVFLSVFSGIPSVCKQVVSVETTRDIKWATHTCTLGFQVFGKCILSLFSFFVYVCVHLTFEVTTSLCSSSGLWPDGSDGTDINAVCTSNDESLLVTGDDFGKVHLFAYPCSQFRVSYCAL